MAWRQTRWMMIQVKSGMDGTRIQELLDVAASMGYEIDTGGWTVTNSLSGLNAMQVYYLVVMNSDAGDPAQVVMCLRQTMSPLLFVETDFLFAQLSGRAAFMEFCNHHKVWDRLKLRGILDLRVYPSWPVSIAGRSHIPVYREWDIYMKMIE